MAVEIITTSNRTLAADLRTLVQTMQEAAEQARRMAAYSESYGADAANRADAFGVSNGQTVNDLLVGMRNTVNGTASGDDALRIAQFLAGYR